jgi:hypothetical protein
MARGKKDVVGAVWGDVRKRFFLKKEAKTLAPWRNASISFKPLKAQVF